MTLKNDYFPLGAGGKLKFGKIGKIGKIGKQKTSGPMRSGDEMAGNGVGSVAYNSITTFASVVL